jgi:parallel beta-helix repeat protein
MITDLIIRFDPFHRCSKNPYISTNQNPEVMKTFTVFFLFIPVMVFSQTYIPITNNMTINSNSDIKFIPGNYVFTDQGLDGVIKINDVHDVILDGDSCTVNGTNYAGYMIKINNSNNIIIKNFDSVFNYKYAVYITNSDHITINGNVFSRNKVDSAGWIDVWADYTAALGGGVMMYHSRAAEVFDNVMKYQNDGVALYHCDSINVHDNDFAWNTSYGIRMFYTDTCHIYDNTANHINRPQTDPSDCAAILLIISNSNIVEHNDFSWSGDGIFLGQYQHSNIPNNNYFAWNECSYSPHNAIEATFADGNIYLYNNCNFSHYGFWLGYSFNSLVNHNEINGNFNSGIAIDRGFNNTIESNTIKNNPIGIELWKGANIAGYESQTSHDYYIFDNTIEGNTQGISSISTQHVKMGVNHFDYNQNQAVYIGTASPQDTIVSNDFRMTTGYHIQNNSTNDVYAVNNYFEPSDTAWVSLKIYDKKDNSTKGRVIWYPTGSGSETSYQYSPPCDMAEPPSTWYAYPQIGYPGPRLTDTVYFDSTEKKVGAASVKMVSGRGWDDALNYRAGNDSVSLWSLTDNDTLYFWVRTIKNVVIGFQAFHIRIGDFKGNYYKYTASTALLNSANLVWKRYQFPLSGNSTFTRTTVGNMSLDSVNYVEFHADTWDYGYTLWLDGLQFSPCVPPLTGIAVNSIPGVQVLTNYPNPFSGTTEIIYELSAPGKIVLGVWDIFGREIRLLDNAFRHPGKYSVRLHSDDMSPGLYFIKLISSKSTSTRKIIITN